MRLRQTRVRSFVIKPRTVTKDNEGIPIINYESGYEVTGEIWPATSQRQIEMYGDRVSDIANVRLEGEYTITLTANNQPIVTFADGNMIHLGDGFCVYSTGDPDYQILSFTQYEPLKLEVERRG